MIEILFGQLNEKILVRIDGEKVEFGSTSFGAVLSEIDGLQLDYEGVVREHPDLKDNPKWKEESIKRFKEKIKLLTTEEERADYIIEDLRKHDFIPLIKQKKGFRPISLR